jgi:hypothetical protein
MVSHTSWRASPVPVTRAQWHSMPAASAVVRTVAMPVAASYAAQPTVRLAPAGHT